MNSKLPNEPKYHIIFHKISPLQDFIQMTLAAMLQTDHMKAHMHMVLHTWTVQWEYLTFWK